MSGNITTSYPNNLILIFEYTHTENQVIFNYTIRSLSIMGHGCLSMMYLLQKTGYIKDHLKEKLKTKYYYNNTYTDIIKSSNEIPGY